MHGGVLSKSQWRRTSLSSVRAKGLGLDKWWWLRGGVASVVGCSSLEVSTLPLHIKLQAPLHRRDNDTVPAPAGKEAACPNPRREPWTTPLWKYFLPCTPHEVLHPISTLYSPSSEYNSYLH